MISICCCWPSARSPVVAAGSTSRPIDPPRSRSRSRATPVFEAHALRLAEHEVLEHRQLSARASCAGRPCRSRARSPASATRSRTSRPSSRIRPSSGRTIPERMFMSVDLPAPFSPSRQCTSPRWTMSEMRSLASTPGYSFVISMSSTAGSPFASGVVRLLIAECCGRGDPLGSRPAHGRYLIRPCSTS